MIITAQKPLDEILDFLSPYDSILIAGCDGCTQPPRGLREAKTLAQLLELGGKLRDDKSCERGLGMPLGPLRAADASGLDVILACINTLHREFGDKYLPAPLMVKLVRAGRLGRKTGRGVYEY